MFNKKHKIGDVISKLRKEKGWTQNELAEKLQVSDKAISKWESNKGDPSIEFLPMLAELFGVTLDYLMTGKEQEEKIITMSKLELCTKEDNVNSYRELKLSLNYKDENHKNVFDYIFEYKSKNLFKELTKNFTILTNENKNDVTFLENFYYMRLLCNDESIVRDFVRLEHQNSKTDNHLGVHKEYIGYNGSRLVSVKRKILLDKTIDLLMYNDNIDNKIKEAILSNYEDKQNKYYAPALSYPYIVLYVAKQKDWPLAKLLIDNALKFNINNAERKIPTYDIAATYLGFVNFPQELFEVLFDNEQYGLIKMAQDTNKVYKNKYYNNSLYKDIYVINDLDYQIEASKIKQNSKLSNKEKALRLAIHDGIVSIDELIEINDFDLYEKTLRKYPISICEILYNQIKNKNYKQIYQYSLDNNIHYLIEDFQKRDGEKLESDFAFYVFDKNLSNEINVDYLKKYINKEEYRKNDLYPPHYPFKLRKNKSFPQNLFELIKDYVFLLKVLDKDIKFVEKACKNATQEELDEALTIVEPNNFKAINILLNHGAKLHKVWTEDDGWGYMVNRDEIDEIGTELLKKKIKEALGEK
ncbi:MAG: helix-turn-helix domain-containing protein [Clostridia bacterium]|nr:helix-turn-helix domain-containing protein [Clostridia bacterium]